MADKKGGKKDTAKNAEQIWEGTTNPFALKMLKLMRNKKKKLEKINETEKKVKRKEIEPNQEQLDMINSKPAQEQMQKEYESILALYKETVDGQGGDEAPKKQKPKKAAPVPAKQEEVKVEAQSTPQVDPEDIIRATLNSVADCMILQSMKTHYQQTLPGHENYHSAVDTVNETYKNLIHSQKTFIWKEAREAFVDTFTKLAKNSMTQVGQTGLTFEDIHKYVSKISETDQLNLFTTQFEGKQRPDRRVNNKKNWRKNQDENEKFEDAPEAHEEKKEVVADAQAHGEDKQVQEE